jgi:regulatory ArsR family protein
VAPTRPRFEIWEVSERIYSVDNVVRLRLLHLLEEGPRRLPELVRLTGKAKSTLSELHVRPLVSSGLVLEEMDPRDARTKVYRLAGQRLGSSDVDVARLRASVLAYAARAAPTPAAALLKIVDVAALVEAGADDAYLRALASRLGRALGEAGRGKTDEEAVAGLDRELRAAGLGSLRRAQGRLHVEAKAPALRQFLEHFAAAALEHQRAP